MVLSLRTPALDRIHQTVVTGGFTARTGDLLTSVAAHLLLATAPTCFKQTGRGIGTQEDGGAVVVHGGVLLGMD